MSDFLRERILRQMREMEAILPQVERELRLFPNVDHVIVGAKEVKGVATRQPAFQVYVRAKKRAGELAADEAIPAEIFGFPTDVILIQGSSRTDDTDTYRPLAGGGQLEAAGTGTLGMIVLTTAGGTPPAGTPVILTNSHVAPREGKPVWQPSSPWYCCKCCECGDVGRVVTSRMNTQIDAAIATLNSDVRFTHEILEVGAVRGWTSATTMAAGDVVFKRGRTTKLTEGRFSSATGSTLRDGSILFTNQIRVTSPLPVAPATTQVPFQLGGDSGAVLLDDQQRVIGLMHAAVLPAGVEAYACRIENVRSALNIDIPVMGTAGAIPLTGGPMAVHDGLAEEVRRLASVYLSPEHGQRWWNLAQQYRDEVAHLINNHRPTTAAWHRYHGPSFVSHYIKTLKENDYLVPEEIGGLRVESLLLGMAATLQEHGSAELSQAIWRHYLQIIEAAKGCRTVEAFLDRISKLPPTGAGVETSEFSNSEVPVG